MANTKIKNRCHCLVWHPQTPEERALVGERLDYARGCGDTSAILVHLMALTGPCPGMSEDHS